MREFGKFAIKGFARAVPVSLANSDQATLVFAHLQKGSRLANSYIGRGVGKKLKFCRFQTNLFRKLE